MSAFLAAARDGNFGRLLEVLAPEVVLRVDAGLGQPAPFEVTGARAVAEQILRTAPRFLPYGIPATVNGAPAVLYGTWDEPLCVLAFTVTDGKIAEMHLIGHRARLRRLRLSLAPGPR